jgi:hypothetical protein
VVRVNCAAPKALVSRPQSVIPVDHARILSLSMNSVLSWYFYEMNAVYSAHPEQVRATHTNARAFLHTH